MTGLSVELHDTARDIAVSFTLDKGSVTALLGPNGAGKSTILHAVAGLHRPTRAKIVLNGRVLHDDRRWVSPYRRNVVLLAQQALLFPHLTVLDNVAFAPRSTGVSKAAARRMAARWLGEVDAMHLADRKPAHLSGGQAQRIALARALAADPQLLLLDEPTAALDADSTPELRSLLRRTLRDTGQTALIVTHDPLDAYALTDRAVVLEAGRVTDSGPIREVLTRPRSRFGATIAGLNIAAGTVVEAGCVQTESGQFIYGTNEGILTAGTAALVAFHPSTVAVYLEEPPRGSPRNHFLVSLTGAESHGSTVRLHSVTGDTELIADVTAAAAAELELLPGKRVWFVVKAAETHIYPR